VPDGRRSVLSKRFQASEIWGMIPVTEICGTIPVTVVSKFAQSDMAELYGIIDVVLAPSVWPESFGFVTREAVGLPLLGRGVRPLLERGGDVCLAAAQRTGRQLVGQ
jgi:glycosyltransferase involved in cell wall biosynthesis